MMSLVRGGGVQRYFTCLALGSFDLSHLCQSEPKGEGVKE